MSKPGCVRKGSGGRGLHITVRTLVYRRAFQRGYHAWFYLGKLDNFVQVSRTVRSSRKFASTASVPSFTRISETRQIHSHSLIQSIPAAFDTSTIPWAMHILCQNIIVVHLARKYFDRAMKHIRQFTLSPKAHQRLSTQSILPRVMYIFCQNMTVVHLARMHLDTAMARLRSHKSRKDTVKGRVHSLLQQRQKVMEMGLQFAQIFFATDWPAD